jgi:L-asparaginase II
MLAGENCFCTVLMEAYRGAPIDKLGTDSFYAVAIKTSEQTRQLGVAGGLGIMAKIEGGNIAVLYAAGVEILMRLRI